MFGIAGAATTGCVFCCGDAVWLSALFDPCACDCCIRLSMTERPYFPWFVVPKENAVRKMKATIAPKTIPNLKREMVRRAAGDKALETDCGFLLFISAGMTTGSRFVF